MTKKTLLLLTDLSYQAKGREYFREDIELSYFIRKFFKVCMCHIDDIEKVIENSDAILIRNTGPQASHRKQLKALQTREDLIIFNDLSGKGDICGKIHLLELFRNGFPVIPTFGSKEEIKEFGDSSDNSHYLIKPLDGADSCGVEILTIGEILKNHHQNVLFQPLVNFKYEVSFYFIGREFHYALYAPKTDKRWELKPYSPSEEDIEFALRFIEWNTCKFGIQRVDACRLLDGRLLLMELEDYNPFLSLPLLQDSVK